MNPTEPELICKVIPENGKKKFHNGSQRIGPVIARRPPCDRSGCALMPLLQKPLLSSFITGITCLLLKI